MARHTPHLCRAPGCREILLDGPGLCSKHRGARAKATRTPAEYGYGTRAWRTVRDQYVAANPTCMAVENGRLCGRPVETVHHRDGRRPRDPGANAWSNLASSCQHHHRLVTNGHPVVYAPTPLTSTCFDPRERSIH